MTIVTVWTWLESKRPKMKILFSELYLVLSILRLLEAAVGEWQQKFS